MFRLSPKISVFLALLASLCFGLLAVLPVAAQEDSDDGPVLLSRKDADVRLVEKGKGWFRVNIYDSSKPSRGKVSDLLYLTAEGLKGAPLPKSELEELILDFYPEEKSRSQAQGTPRPQAGAQRSACSSSGGGPGGGPGGGSDGIIVVDLVQMQRFQRLEAEGKVSPDSQWQDADDASSAANRGCFGWNDKRKTRSWNVSNNSISDSFNLGGGFTGSYQVQLPFQTAGTATLNYRIKKKFCVPYKFRFKSIKASGTAQLLGNASLSANAALAYKWDKEWKVANPKIADINFWVGPIPVWIDVFLPTYVGLGLDAKVAAGISVDADFGASGSFEYTCSTDDCCGQEDFQDTFDTQGVSASLEAEIKAQANAKIAVRAELWSDNLFWAEAGVKGFVEADVWGYYGNACGDADGDGQNETVRALTVDAEAGFDWVYGVGGALVPDRDGSSEGGRYPLGFTDLLGEGGSTALSPMLTGPTSIDVGGTATYRAKMRPCYPYTDAVNLNIGPGTWTGTAQIAKPKSANAAENSTTLSRPFTVAGTKTVTLEATGDAAGRSLSTVTERQLEVEPEEPVLVHPQRGMWYNPARSGHGITFYSNNANNFVLVWLTYTASGSPTWYISDTAAVNGNTWSASLFRSTLRPDGTNMLTTVGQVAMDFSNSATADFSWTLNGQSGSEPFQFLHGGSGRSGLWYSPSDSIEGWGLILNDASNTLVATLTVYSGSQPTWIQGIANSTADATINLFHHTSPDLCPSCGGNTAPTASPAGSLRVRVASGSSGTGFLSTAATAPGSSWFRNDQPIHIITTP